MDLLALYPGQQEPACRVHLHGVSPGDGQVLAVHLTCYPHDQGEGTYCWDRTPPTYAAVTLPAPREVFERRIASHSDEAQRRALTDYEDHRRRAARAHIVTARIFDDAPPALALDHLVRRYWQASAYAVVIDERSCLAAVRMDDKDLLGTPCG